MAIVTKNKLEKKRLEKVTALGNSDEAKLFAHSCIALFDELKLKQFIRFALKDDKGRIFEFTMLNVTIQTEK